MAIQIGQLLDANGYNRQAALNAWLQLKGLSKSELADKLGVHPSMISRIISGQRAPARRIRQLVALGIPAELLPSPSLRSRGRPKNKSGTALSED